MYNFIFDGKSLNLNESPASLKMEDEDYVDIVK